MTYTIDDKHLLQGPGVKHVATTKKSRGGNRADYIVFHYSAGRTFQGDVNALSTSNRKASAHLVFGRAGEITQIGNFRDILWHAGRSSYDGLNGMNKYSVGIEITNPGWLKPIGNNKYQSWFGQTFDKDVDGLIISKHPTMGNTKYGWLPYTPMQLEACVEIGEVLMDRYNMIQAVGHEDVSPGRKQDPANGIIFPNKIYGVLNGANDRASVEGLWADDDVDVKDETKITAAKTEAAQAEMFGSKPATRRSKVDNLNVRVGPSTRYPRIGQLDPQRDYTVVIPSIESEGADWTLLQIDETTQGWVATRFLL